MPITTRLLLGLGAAQLVATSALGGGVSVFLGAPGEPGSVRIYDEDGVTPPVHPPALQGIVLLPLELAGRTQFEELLDGRARWRDDVPGASRLQLPGGSGSVYRYRRVDPGVVVQGLMLVGADGVAHSLLELAESGTEVAPFHPRIAVAPMGNALLLATTFAAGGDLLEIAVPSGTICNRTADLPPQYFEGHGLGLRDSWGLGVSTEGVLRFDRSTASQAQPVPFSPPPTWFGREVVFSANGQFAATIAGEEPARAHAWVLSASGPALRSGDAPAALAGAGFLPDVDGGPWLAVSDDGTLCAWKTEAGHGYSRELYLGRLSASGSSTTLHVTQDALFEPYIDEIGQYAFRPGGTLLFSAGNPKGVGKGALVDMDVFQVSWPTGGAPELLNLTLSSGEAHPPFVTYPELQPECSLLLPDAAGVLVHSVAGGLSSLLAAEPDTAGALVVLEGAATLDVLGLAEQEHLLLAETAVAPQGSALRDLELPVEEAPESLMPLAAGQTIVRAALGSHERIALVTSDGSSERVWRVVDDHVSLLTPRPLRYGPTLAFTSQDSIALSVGGAGKPSLFVLWRSSGPPLRLDPVPAVGFVLP